MIAAWLTMTTASAGGAFLQVGTGQRMLDLPTADLVAGGGLRVGYDAGPVVPFIGGNVVVANLGVDADGDEYQLGGSSWSVAAGLRVDLVDEEGPAQAFLSVGGTVGRQAGVYEFVEFDEAYRIEISSGPGAFVGAGADAFLSERVALGLEVGGAYTTGSFTAEYLEDGNVEDDVVYDKIDALYTYADLHLVFRFGGAR